MSCETDFRFQISDFRCLMPDAWRVYSNHKGARSQAKACTPTCAAIVEPLSSAVCKIRNCAAHLGIGVDRSPMLQILRILEFLVRQSIFKSRSKTDFRCLMPGECTPTETHPTTNYQLPTTNYQLPTTNYQLPTTNYQLPTTNYQLPTANS